MEFRQQNTFIYDLAITFPSSVMGLTETGTRINNLGFSGFLYKMCDISMLEYTAKTMVALINLLALDCLKTVGKVFSALKDLTYAVRIFDSTNSLVNPKVFSDPNDNNNKWYNQMKMHVNNSLLFLASVGEVADFSSKWLGVGYFPVFSEISAAICSVPAIKEAFEMFPLLKHLFINKLKDLLILVNCIFNVIFDISVLIFGNDKDRERILTEKNLMTQLGDVGKIILICLGVSYFEFLAYRIFSLFIALTAQTKKLAYG